MVKIAKFVKKVTKSSKGYLIWIPKDVIDYLELKDKNFVEFSIKKAYEEGHFTSIKRISLSGKNILLWIPKDISDSLHLEKKSIVEISMKKLENEQ